MSVGPIQQVTSMDIRIEKISMHSALGPREAALIFADEAIALVLTKLTTQELVGMAVTSGWFAEAGFGACEADRSTPVFRSLDAASAWVDRRLS